MENRINLIGIAGKKRHGKNTVAYIIQHQIARSKGYNTVSYPEKEDAYLLDHKSEWKQKSFAFKLKQIASLLLGIPLEDFEKEEVKNRLLPPQWTKITAKTEEVMTVRGFLQKLGTEAMRDVIHPEIWVNALFADYNPGLSSRQIVMDALSDTDKKMTSKESLPNWIVTDVRFPNEAEAIVERGGLLIKVFRPGKLKVWFNDRVNSDEEDDSGYYFVQSMELREKGKYWILSEYPDGTGGTIEGYLPDFDLEFSSTDIHPSEIALDNYPFKDIIINGGSIEDLNHSVKSLLEKYKII